MLSQADIHSGLLQYEYNSRKMCRWLTSWSRNVKHREHLQQASSQDPVLHLHKNHCPHLQYLKCDCCYCWPAFECCSAEVRSGIQFLKKKNIEKRFQLEDFKIKWICAKYTSNLSVSGDQKKDKWILWIFQNLFHIISRTVCILFCWYI